MNLHIWWFYYYAALFSNEKIVKPDNWLSSIFIVTLHNTTIHSTQYNTWPWDCVLLLQLLTE